MSLNLQHVRDLSLVEQCDLAAQLTQRGHPELASWVIVPPRCFNAWLRLVSDELERRYPAMHVTDLSMASAFYFYSQGETAEQFIAKVLR